ncbi:MAG TPA: CcmD family protein [Bacteroidota bacterium]|nr:CcmD family protein [Bacteroidota bacterium]
MEEFLSTNQMYIVLTIVLLIWGGIIAYLMRLEKRIIELEKVTKKG